MALTYYAQIQLDSPLPQLDNVFDYQIPDDIDLEIGSRVRVPFGKSKKLLSGFVIAKSEKSDHDTKMLDVSNVTTNATILKPEIYKLCRAIADRQCVAVAEVIGLAVPNRSVAIEKKWLLENWRYESNTGKEDPKRTHHLVNLRSMNEKENWIGQISATILKEMNEGNSVIVCLPDHCDQTSLLDALRLLIDESKIVDYSGLNKPSIRYANFLKCLSNDNLVVVGSRSAIYAPVAKLGMIIVWDDGDSSHQDVSSPYIHTREAALIRQDLEKCSIAFFSHSMSMEMHRLRKIGYLSLAGEKHELPKIMVTNSEVRVSGEVWRVIRESLSRGSVLVQVGTKGISASSFCSSCSIRAVCKKCSGPLTINQTNLLQCRWCNAFNLDFVCPHCAGTSIKSGRAGSTKTLADLGKAFPGVQLIESTSENRVQKVIAKNALVVATPGAEPRFEPGYAAVIILDADNSLLRDSLRATEDALRIWFNAFSLADFNAQLVIANLTGELAESLRKGQLLNIAEREYQQRFELRLPPAIRVCSISAETRLLSEFEQHLQNTQIEVFGPVKIRSNTGLIDHRLLLKFDYSEGLTVARKLKEIAIKLSVGQTRFSAKSGRPMRPIRIKMDDPEVV